MVTVYVTSTEPYSGKTLTCLVLGLRWRSQGLKVGFLKPLGLLPLTVPAPEGQSGDRQARDGEVTDEDAWFVARQLGFEAPASQLCPVILGPQMCRADRQQLPRRVQEAFAASAVDRDVMLVGGLGSVFTRGATFGLDGRSIAEMLDAKVLLVTRSDSFLAADGIVAAHQMLGERLVGVVLNRVPTPQRPEVEREVLPCLRQLGITVFGMVPDDPLLSSVSVKEIVEATGGELLAGESACDELVENFIVGAMAVESALRHFRRTPRKCVITGGDRSDIQFAALETSTRCLILTGHLQPRYNVIARAQELGVPVVLLRDDTLAAVTKVEQLVGKQRVRQPKKIEHAQAQFEINVDLEKLDSALGLH